MATSLTINSSYAGEAAGEYFRAGINEATTIKDGLVTVLENIPFKRVLRKYASTDGTIDYSCTFAPAGSVTLSESILEPKRISRDMEFCKEEFLADWDAVSMSASANLDSMPANIEDFLIVTEVAKQSAKIDSDIWVGSGTTTGQFDGFINLWLADSDINDTTATGVTASNVIAELGKQLDAVSDVVLGADDFVFVISSNVARAYTRALGALGFSNLGVQFGKEMDFEGFKLNVIPNLPANTMACYRKSNLYFGTALLSDSTSIRVIDMSETTQDDKVTMRMVYSAGVQYIDGTEIYLYKG